MCFSFLFGMNYNVLNSFANCTAQLLGFDNFIPPFAATSGDQLLGGANFASAAAGIRAETGQQLVCMFGPSGLGLFQLIFSHIESSKTSRNRPIHSSFVYQPNCLEPTRQQPLTS